MLFRFKTLGFPLFCYGAVDMWIMETNLISEFGNSWKLIEVKILLSVALLKFLGRFVALHKLLGGLVESGFSMPDEM